jgi:hypothetical protein
VGKKGFGVGRKQGRGSWLEREAPGRTLAAKGVKEVRNIAEKKCYKAISDTPVDSPHNF